MAYWFDINYTVKNMLDSTLQGYKIPAPLTLSVDKMESINLLSFYQLIEIQLFLH